MVARKHQAASPDQGPISDAADIDALRALARSCRACHLWERGTQTVFGEGPEGAFLMFIGEQPGDGEDRAGRPFVGPAGHLLDKALEEARIDRSKVYVTNVVKHFKWEPRGKRRIHSRPIGPEIGACRPWLDAEIALVRPRGIVCLGATAAQTLLGRTFLVTERRGEPVPSDLAQVVMATVHPSAILRQPDRETRHLEFRRFVRELETIARALERLGGPA